MPTDRKGKLVYPAPRVPYLTRKRLQQRIPGSRLDGASSPQPVQLPLLKHCEACIGYDIGASTVDVSEVPESLGSDRTVSHDIIAQLTPKTPLAALRYVAISKKNQMGQELGPPHALTKLRIGTGSGWCYEKQIALTTYSE